MGVELVVALVLRHPKPKQLEQVSKSISANDIHTNRGYSSKLVVLFVTHFIFCVLNEEFDYKFFLIKKTYFALESNSLMLRSLRTSVFTRNRNVNLRIP